MNRKKIIIVVLLVALIGGGWYGYSEYNRKVKDLAKMSALSYKAKENAIVVVEDINLDAPKTKTVVDILGNLNVADKKLMLIQAAQDANLLMSVRNVPSVLGVALSDMNTYDIVNSEVLVLTESAAKIFADTEEAVEA